jgi:hypothetical protein
MRKMHPIMATVEPAMINGALSFVLSAQRAAATVKMNTAMEGGLELVQWYNPIH